MAACEKIMYSLLQVSSIEALEMPIWVWGILATMLNGCYYVQSSRQTLYSTENSKIGAVASTLACNSKTIQALPLTNLHLDTSCSPQSRRTAWLLYDTLTVTMGLIFPSATSPVLSTLAYRFYKGSNRYMYSAPQQLRGGRVSKPNVKESRLFTTAGISLSAQVRFRLYILSNTR